MHFAKLPPKPQLPASLVQQHAAGERATVSPQCARVTLPTILVMMCISLQTLAPPRVYTVAPPGAAQQPENRVAIASSGEDLGSEGDINMARGSDQYAEGETLWVLLTAATSM